MLFLIVNIIMFESKTYFVRFLPLQTNLYETTDTILKYKLFLRKKREFKYFLITLGWKRYFSRFYHYKLVSKIYETTETILK